MERWGKDEDLSFEKLERVIQEWESQASLIKKPLFFFSLFALKNVALIFKTAREECFLCHESLRTKLIEAAPHVERFEIGHEEFIAFLERWAKEQKLTSRKV